MIRKWRQRDRVGRRGAERGRGDRRGNGGHRGADSQAKGVMKSSFIADVIEVVLFGMNDSILARIVA